MKKFINLASKCEVSVDGAETFDLKNWICSCFFFFFFPSSCKTHPKRPCILDLDLVEVGMNLGGPMLSEGPTRNGAYCHRPRPCRSGPSSRFPSLAWTVEGARMAWAEQNRKLLREGTLWDADKKHSAKFAQKFRQSVQPKPVGPCMRSCMCQYQCRQAGRSSSSQML